MKKVFAIDNHLYFGLLIRIASSKVVYVLSGV